MIKHRTALSDVLVHLIISYDLRGIRTCVNSLWKSCVLLYLQSFCEGAELFTHPPVWASRGVSLADQRGLRLGQEQVGQPLPYVNNLEVLVRNAF